MTLVAASEQVDVVLTGDILAHLDAQLIAARRLLQVVLEQGAAIRRRDVRSVVALTGILQAELQRRQLIDAERMRLLERAGARLGIVANAVTLARLETLMDANGAQMARERSSELRGLLEETKREHHVNRALMNQELAFLDHLLRLAGQGNDTVYDHAGDRPSAVPSAYSANRRVFDLEV
jgi:hypothetical protein